MSEIRKHYKVFIASPGDIETEREIVRKVCGELSKNPLYKKKLGIVLDAVGWEEVFPQAGRSQKIINRLVKDCDLFICIFHKRFGSPTGKEKSGTLE